MFLIDDTALMALIREDVPAGDLTTRSLGLAAEAGELTMRARGAMTVACSEEAVRILQLLGAEAWIATASGRQVEGGEMLLFARGQVEALLAGWKVAQNLIEWASGLASSATAIVAAARAVNPAVTVACTRKSVPGTRALSLRAVTVGGATVHRTGLSDSVLLFAEHRAFGGDDALASQIARLRAICPERKVVVEVADVAEALAAAQAGAEVLQLEKFPPAQVAEVVAGLPADWRGHVAAAGGITAANAAAYAAAGAQVLVTSAPFTAPPRDVAVWIGPA
ncbi:ModD protein [Rhodobacter capsulatus]|uniref:ModD protein n=1 Tax=Rhodobacter capsulatus TaxID=1061 RepID=UPI0006DC27AB|nr:ModD protein [Rhodobacter capsulatus]KQB13246.1 pyrophosphorylase [Rhodobacter capsulatus]KQB13506.1 pyrophosphorylase [Rhodobacter capsulatus]PZX24224.1 molybdenum transport protein [Rhodobacter capsulatus]QNR63798.1 ModD protein [Rhodobacter capsulatus]